MRNSIGGLTALELLIALTIITVLVSAGVPAFRAFGLNQRMNAAVTALQSDLQYARSESIHGSTHTVVCPGKAQSGCLVEQDWDRGWIVFSDPNADRTRQPEETLLRVGGALHQVAISSSQSRRRLHFFPNGTAPGSNTSILFCDARGMSHARQIRISNTGRIRRTTDKVPC